MPKMHVLEDVSKGLIKFGQKGADAFVSIEGVVDEELDFSRLTQEVQKLESLRSLSISLDRVVRMNSMGLRELYRFLISIPKSLDYHLVEVSEVVIDQTNLIHFLKDSKDKVISFFGRYACRSCKSADRILLTPSEVLFKAGVARAPARPCKQCGKPMDFDDDEKEFFRFLSS